MTDESKRRIFTIATTTVITIEPSKRSYDPASRERLYELFGEPERWASTTTNFRWAQTDTLVPAFEGSTEFELVVPCTYDLEVAAVKYFHGLAEGEAPLRFHFNGTVFYESDEGRMQIVHIPWDRSPRFRMPLDVWRQTIDAAYPWRGWIPMHTETIARLERRKAERGLPTFDATIDELLGEETTPATSSPSAPGVPGEDRREAPFLEELVSSLLYEGYALYPYTPGATKNATPTPFGIVYPPDYAALNDGDPRPPPGRVHPRRRRGRDRLRDDPLPAPGRRAPPGDRAPRRAAGDADRRARRGPRDRHRVRVPPGGD